MGPVISARKCSEDLCSNDWDISVLNKDEATLLDMKFDEKHVKLILIVTIVMAFINFSLKSIVHMFRKRSTRAYEEQIDD